jgi:predicted alpha/beta superfamily hydrolase
MNIIALFLGSFICLNLNSCANNSAGLEMKSYNIPQNFMDTTFISKFVNDSIKVDVSLPSNYDSNQNKKFKVIYMTDGYWRREEHSTIHQMSDNKEIDQVIVVGIGYPDDYDFNNIRIRDLIINAGKLYSCIKEEVIPYVERKYRADSNDRTLWGSSYGGYFLIWSFTEHFKQGELFKNYICASAALNPPYKHDDLIKKENEMWNNHKDLPVNLYLTVGGNETKEFIDSYNTITASIKSHNYSNFHFEFEIIPGTDHYSVWKPTLLDGLRKFLKPR